MFFRFPAYTQSVDIPFNGDITSSELNTKISNIDNYIENNSNYVSTQYSASTSVNVLSLANIADCAAGDITLTLPSAAAAAEGAYYVFKRKDGNTTRSLTLQTAPGDYIENTRIHTSTASNTTLQLQQPDSSVVLMPVNDSEWRIVSAYFPNSIWFEAKMSANQEVNGVTLVDFDQATQNIGNGFDGVNSRFTAPCDGLYIFNATIAFEAGSVLSTDPVQKIFFFRNGLEEITASEGKNPDVTKVTRYTVSLQKYLIKGDYIDVRVETIGGTGRVKKEERQTRFSGCLITYGF